MAPICVGLIGLSASASTSWASRAHLPYLVSAQGQEKYRIVALCNSSVEAAEKAIAAFGLPTETRAYGDPADLAADDGVDLVVCNTRVDKHYETILPSVAAGKAVFSEWPLAHDIAHVRELSAIAKESGSRTAVGLQGRLGPVVQKIKELLSTGRVGKVLSSEVRASGGLNGRNKAPESLAYFFDKKVGGNVFTIGFGHLFDTVLSAVGEIRDIQSQLQTQRPDVQLFDRDGTIIKTIRSNTPDLILLNARLVSPGIATQDASLSIRFRTGEQFPGEAPLVWTITGEKGEIRLVSEEGASLNVMAWSKPPTIEVHDFESGNVSQVDLAWPSWQTELPIPARNIAAIYESFANADSGEHVSFNDALTRHSQLQAMLDHWETEKTA